MKVKLLKKYYDIQFKLKKYIMEKYQPKNPQEALDFMFDEFQNSQKTNLKKNLYDSIQGLLKQNPELNLSMEKQSYLDSKLVVYGKEEVIIENLERIKINSFALPSDFIKLIQTGLWKKDNIDKKKLLELIIQHNPFEYVQMKFMKEHLIEDLSLYSVKLMNSESESLYRWRNENFKEYRIMMLGKLDNDILPGNILPEKTILFADFGLGSDQGFSLDYRESETEPVVLLHYWGKNASKDNRWKKIANSFEEFAKQIIN